MASGTIVLPVNKAGDTMIGDLYLNPTNNAPAIYLKSSAADYANTVSSPVYESIYFTDKNNKLTSYIQSVERATGQTELVLAARNKMSGSEATNALSIKVDDSGAQQVQMTHPAAWLTAIGAISKTGNNTISGELKTTSRFYTQHATPCEFIMHNTTADVTAGSGASSSKTYIKNIDKNGSTFGWVQWDQFASGTTQASLAVRHTYNGSAVDNVLSMAVLANGTRLVAVSDYAAWQKALEIIPFKISTTVLSGSYIRYPVGSATDSRITANHICLITPYYTTGTIGTHFYTNQCANGYVNIYIRDSSGNNVAQGTTINLAGIIIKP